VRSTASARSTRWSGRAAGCTCTWARGGTTRREARRPGRRPPRPVEAGGLRRPRSGSGGRWAPATAHAIPLAQGSVLVQLRRDGSPFGSSGQVAGRMPRRSRALLACQQDTDEACRSWQGAACWFPEMPLKAPSPQGRPAPDLCNSARYGVRREVHRRALNRLSGLQDSEADRERWCLERHRPGELAGRRAANRGRAPAATLATSLLACRQPTRPSAETTLHGCGRHTRRRCPPARLSSAHAQPAQPLAPRLPSPRDATASPVQGSGPCTRTRTGRCRGDPARSHAGPRQGRSASLRRVTAGPAGRKHPATAASW
jgi:hypothetical protein